MSSPVPTRRRDAWPLGVFLAALPRPSTTTISERSRYLPLIAPAPPPPLTHVAVTAPPRRLLEQLFCTSLRSAARSCNSMAHLGIRRKPRFLLAGVPAARPCSVCPDSDVDSLIRLSLLVTYIHSSMPVSCWKSKNPVAYAVCSWGKVFNNVSNVYRWYSSGKTWTMQYIR